MKVTLICPKNENEGMQNLSAFNLPPTSLNLLASMTPLNWEVEIINENTNPINFEKHTDLVGITAMTKEVTRGYQIADKYREKGVGVVIGGVHASMLPEEAKEHADSVVVGEADLMWGKVLDDFRKGNLKSFYCCPPPSNLDITPLRTISRTYYVQPSRLLPIRAKFSYIQTQRGCPNNCEWCSVAKFSGTKVRYKSIPFLLKETESLGNFDYLFVSDDNIIGNTKRAKELFQALIPLKIRWITQSDIRIADDQIIDLACESGLSGVMLGLESINPKNLNKSAPVKKIWRSKYEEV
ncbi:B12-binding domain-containing radical SAM protein, partial [Patescibacteria group bacterium]